MKVSEVMTEKVLYCRQDASANAAAQLMWENNCGSVPIVDDSLKLVGILTDRDICMAAYTQGLPLGCIRVTSAMAREPVCVGADDDVSAAHRLMRAHQVRRLPVVDAQGKLGGMVALADLARAAQGREALEIEVGKTLAAISQTRSGDTMDKQHLVETPPESDRTPAPSQDEGASQPTGQGASTGAATGASETHAVADSTKISQSAPSPVTDSAAEARAEEHPESTPPATSNKPESPTPRPPSRRRGPRRR